MKTFQQIPVGGFFMRDGEEMRKVSDASAVYEDDAWDDDRAGYAFALHADEQVGDL